MAAVLIAGMVLLILINGFFVAAEFALVRTGRAGLDPADARSALVMRQLDDVGRYLAACQFGITLASLGIGFLGEPAIASLAEPVLGGVVSHGVAVAVALAFAYSVSTAAHITVGEQVPKILAISDAERVARRVARPLEVFARVGGPAIAALHATSNWMLRRIGVDPEAAGERGGGPEEVKQLIAESLAAGGLDEAEAEMLTGVFALSERSADDVMTPFHDVVHVADDDLVAAAVERSLESGHARLPVTAAGSGAVRGVVRLADLVRAERLHGPDARVAKVMREPLIVPEGRPLDSLLEDLQRAHSSLAVVVDEYGRTVGVVAVEDIVEEIVGDIVDESDREPPRIERLGPDELRVLGDTSLTDLVHADVSLPPGDYVSVGGFVTDRLGRVPREGDQVTADGWIVDVEAVRDQRVESVRLRRAD